MKVQEGVSIVLQYRLTYDDQDGELIEESTSEDPLEFTMGKDEMLESFEAKLIGLSVSDTFSFSLAPEEAYGSFNDKLLVEYPKDSFLVEGELDEDFIQEGEVIEMTDDDNNVFQGMIEENKLNTIVINFNHPLAGETIHFSGTISHIS